MNMTLERGALLNNRYRIAEILGQGGMASIYRAVDENLGVDVAVKENLFTTDEYARQFRREAVILASLRHPNLPRVTDHFVIDGQGQYLIMDYIEGEDLRQRMDRIGILPEEEAIVLGAAICEALAYLHSRHPMVLHRDVKPGNVKITPQGQIFLVDFGLAKVVQSGKATTTGARAMTPGYSPPEQYGTARTDQRSDIYSLGATLYSAITDSLPEDGLARAMGQACLTPLRQRNAKISRKLSMIIEKALEVRPDDRFQTAEDFQEELLNARSNSKRRTPVDYNISPPGSSTEAKAEASQVSLPVAVENVVAENAAPFLPVSVSTPLEEPAPRSQPAPRRLGGIGCWTAVIMVGLLIGVFGGLALINPGATRQVMAYLPFFAPSSPTVTQKAKSPSPLAAVKNTGAITVTATTAPATPAPTVSPTSEILSTRTLVASPTVTTNAIPTVTPTPAPTAFAGGAGQIAFASTRSGTAQIWIMNVDGSQETRVTNIPEGACQPSWSPDGQRLVFVTPCTRYQEFYNGSSLFIVNADGTDLTPLPSAPGGDYDPAWSPDGRYIAFTSLRGNFQPKLFLFDLETKEVIKLADEGSKNMQAAWSFDGKKIAFVTTRKGPQQIWIMNADGSSPELFTRSASKRNSYPAWSPDGQEILFTQDIPGETLPWLAKAGIGAEDTRGLRLYNDPGAPMRKAKYSPDGQWIVMEAWIHGENHDVFMMLFNGLSLQRLTEDLALDFDPDWRPVSPASH